MNYYNIEIEREKDRKKISSRFIWFISIRMREVVSSNRRERKMNSNAAGKRKKMIETT